MPDEVARIGALSNGSNGQRSLESASLHFEPICKRERGASRGGACRRNPEPKAKDLLLEALWRRERHNSDSEPTAQILSAAFARRISAFGRHGGREDGTSRVGASRPPTRAVFAGWSEGLYAKS